MSIYILAKLIQIPRSAFVSLSIPNLLKSFQRSKQVVDKQFISLSVQKFRSYYDPMGKQSQFSVKHMLEKQAMKKN